MPAPFYRDPTTRDFVPLLGAPGPQSFAQVSPSEPVPRAVGDLWVDTDDDLLSWDTDWQSPTLQNGWVNYGGAWPPARYRKHLGGLVELQGTVKSGTAALLFTLPVGYRPYYNMLFASVVISSTVRLDVYSNGEVRCSAYNADSVSVNCCFYAER